ncbi:BRO-N domain-containing protein [Nostoc sp.]|uniref:BRO-N domain-containing protein n=1 Tax=Nostoc sp. TaxID=1180 RepID=UPI002FFAC844
MSSLSVFNFESHEIRFVGTADSPWWVAADICKVLEIQNPTQAMDKLDDDERAMLSIGQFTKTISVNCVNESGLYSLVLTSRKPQAKRFKKWLTSEVIPAIRKTGTYAVSSVAIAKHPTSLSLIDTSELDALTKRVIELQTDINHFETLISTTKAELQSVKAQQVVIAKAFAVKHSDIVKHSLMCSEILGAYGDGNKYFSNPLKK